MARAADTVLAFHHGALEVNPGAALFDAHWGVLGLVGHKLVYAVGVPFFFLWMRHHCPGWAGRSVRWCCSVLAIAVNLPNLLS